MNLSAPNAPDATLNARRLPQTRENAKSWKIFRHSFASSRLRGKALYLITLMSLLFLGAGNVLADVPKEHLEMVGPYETPQQVTADCIRCHEDQAEDLSHSRHWRWEGDEIELHGRKVKLGKRSMLNNYCVAVPSNEPRCTSCHVGFGWQDMNVDFSDKTNMDCLVCHEQTGTYKKFPAGAGYPVYLEDEKVFPSNGKTYKKPDFVKVAQSVGKPRIENCGSCHFYGGGGHNVKHGDLNKELVNATAAIDAHMGNADPDKRKVCADCHKMPGKHDIRGATHASMAAGTNHFECTECHKDGHQKRMRSMLDLHAASVACTTCHILDVAKNHATKTWWDWTTAGDKTRGKDGVEKDADGNVAYDWKKGDFRWTKHLKPEYRWYNGKTDYHLLGDKITEPDKVLTFNPLGTDLNDAKARITPFKIMRGKQYYDPKTGHLLVPHLFGKGGYWKSLDWNQAFADGMAAVGLEYSGEYAPIETEMLWPLFHEVSPARDALGCRDCHTRDGRAGALDWAALGYPGDPVKTGQSRLSRQVIE